jgi:hypothetical protein
MAGDATTNAVAPRERRWRPRGSIHAAQAAFVECIRARSISGRGSSGNLSFGAIDHSSSRYQQACQACRSEPPNNPAKRPLTARDGGR